MVWLTSQADGERQRQGQPALEGQAEDLAGAEIAELRVGEGLQVAVGQDLGDAAARNEEDEGRDDRLHVQEADHQTVEQAAQAGGEQAAA